MTVLSKKAAIPALLILSATIVLLLQARTVKNVPFVPKIEVIERETEQTISVQVLTFTQEEAESLITQIREERAAAERAAREKAERQAAARRPAANATYSSSYFKRAGVIHWGGWRWTWYSERILPGYGLRIPGRHTDAQGYVRDGSGYLCLASDKLRKGTIIDTPFGGPGKIYDCGCGMTTIDVYVGW